MDEKSYPIAPGPHLQLLQRTSPSPFALHLPADEGEPPDQLERPPWLLLAPAMAGSFIKYVAIAEGFTEIGISGFERVAMEDCGG